MHSLTIDRVLTTTREYIRQTTLGQPQAPRDGATQDSIGDFNNYAAIARSLKLLQERLPISRRLVHEGDAIYQAGERFGCLYVIHSGIFKAINLSPDGREQVVGLHFKGDWLGFDGIATDRYGCDARALDTGEVWSIRYDALLAVAAEDHAVLGVLHKAMSREIARDRESLMSLCTLSADARVANFLRNWAQALETRGLRTDQITLRMTRAEIGNHLGMTLESVSRALSRLAGMALIHFAGSGRREIHIPNVQALDGFVQESLHVSSTPVQ